MNLQTHSNAQSSHSELRNPNNGDESNSFFEDFESACSTPYVSAPSSPGRGSSGAGGGGFFYSAPASPIHFSLTSSSFIASSSSSSSDNSVPMGYEFEFSARFGSAGPVQPGSMSSADELFLNGKIRPMKLSTHLERPQVLAPLLDLEHEEGEEDGAGAGARGRDLRFRDKSLRRRTRSMSPMRREWTEGETEIEAQNDDEEEKECGRIGTEEKRNNGDVYDDDDDENDTKLATNASSASAPSSRSSSAGRNSKRWMFLKEFLRSKSEGRSNHKYFWSNISSAVKDKKSSSSSPPPLPPQNSSNASNSTSTSTSTSGSDNISANVHDVSGGVSSPKNEGKKGGGSRKKVVAGTGTGARVKPANGVVEKSKNKKKKKTYELHYTANRAQAEEMRKKTYLPYRQGLLGCLGFSSKGYGAVNGLARALNPVSSR